MSEYAEGYLDGVVASSHGKIDIPALEKAVEGRLRQKIIALLKTQRRNAELNMSVKNQTDTYYNKNRGAIDVIDVLLNTLKERFYIQNQNGMIISSYFLGFNQGMFDGDNNEVNMRNILTHIAILDGTANFGIVRDSNNTPRNEDYLAGYYNAVMTLSPTDIIAEIEEAISEHKNKNFGSMPKN
jgi:hypothetical protein